MTNEEKAYEILKSIVDNNQSLEYYQQQGPYAAAMEMAQWKDEQTKQLLIEKTKLLSSSAAQDSVKRCTIEEIYRELFNEELPNSNPYIK